MGPEAYSAFPKFVSGKVLVKQKKKWVTRFLTRTNSLIERNYIFIGITYLIPADIRTEQTQKNVSNTKHINSAVIYFHATKAYGGSISIVPLTFNLGTKWRWVVNFTPRPLYPCLGASVPIRQYAMHYTSRSTSLQSETTPPHLNVRKEVKRFFFSTEQFFVVVNSDFFELWKRNDATVN